jgi:hypothetical protein
MPRKARIDIPGLLQHVIVRGIERRDIFLNDSDRKIFIINSENLALWARS